MMGGGEEWRVPSLAELMSLLESLSKNMMIWHIEVCRICSRGSRGECQEIQGYLRWYGLWTCVKCVTSVEGKLYLYYVSHAWICV